ncbi:transcriptional regulator GutM, partial [Escherichia coli]
QKGRVGVGRSGGRFKPRVVVAVALDENNMVCDSLIMRGVTVFARPTKIQAIDGISLHELQPDVIFPHDSLCQNALS